MKTKLLIPILLLLILSSCLSSPEPAQRQSAEPRKELMVFVHATETSEHRDVACLSIYKGSSEGMSSYTVDRYTENSAMLMVMDFGRYVIEGDVFRYKSEKYTFEGKFTGDRIIIGDDEYLYSPPEVTE